MRAVDGIDSQRRPPQQRSIRVVCCRQAILIERPRKESEMAGVMHDSEAAGDFGMRPALGSPGQAEARRDRRIADQRVMIGADSQFQ